MALPPPKPGSIRYGIEERARKAAANMRAPKNTAYTDAAKTAFPGITSQPAQAEPSGGGGFLQSKLQMMEDAVQGRGQAPADDVSMGAAGMGQEPAPDPFADTAQGGMGYGGALMQGRMMDDAMQTHQVRIDNTPMHDATNQLNEEQKILAMERADNTKDAYTTQAEMARDASVLADEAHQAQAQMAAREQFMAAQQARKRQDIEDNVSRYATATDEAAAEFARTEQFDPGAAWANKSAGRKIRIMLAGLGRGLTGGNPADILKESLQLELAAHRQVRSDAGEKLTAARGQMTNAQQTMQTFLAMTGDERVAEALVEKKTLAGVQAKMRAMEAEYGPRIISDKWTEADNMLQEQMAALDYKIVEREQANPKYFTKTVRHSTMGANERAIRSKMAGQMIDSAGEAVKQGGAAQASGQKQRATDEHGLTEHDWQQVDRYGNNADVAKQEGIVRQIEAIVAPTDIKGVKGFSKDWFGDEPRDLEQKIKLLKEAIGRAQSGGAISEDERDEFKAMVDAGVGFGGGEERLRKNLGEIKGMMESRLETPRRALSPAARRYITRQENADFVGESQRSGKGRKRVQAADGTITTNASEFD